MFHTFRSAEDRTPWQGLVIGGGLALLLGMAFLLAGVLSTGGLSSTATTNYTWGGVIGLVAACLVAPASIGAVIGLGIQKAIRPKRRSTDPTSRSFCVERQRVLRSPVEILVFGFTEGFFHMKDANLILKFANDAYGRSFAQLNNGYMLSYYCSRCGDEIDPDTYSWWVKGVCTDCGKIFCKSCLQTAGKKHCP
ncbi:MAG: hypothetical protein ACM3MF_00795, partial [Anaerolineae bacterium]